MKLFFRETGKGCPLIILHGLYGASDNWASFAKHLGEYFKVYIPDQRNHGKSPHHKDHSYQALCDDLMDFIQDNSIENPVLIGHSMGGKVAMYFAARYPEKTRALVVVDISPKSYSEESENSARFLKHSDITRILAELPLENFKTREDADRELSKYIKPERVRQFLLKNLSREKSGGFTWKINIDALRNNLDHIFSGLDKSMIKKGNYPVMFVKGAMSDYINKDDFRLISELFPSSEIRIIHGAGHWIHAEKPDELFELIVEFLKKNQLCN